jgi:hypothetical protein
VIVPAPAAFSVAVVPLPASGILSPRPASFGNRAAGTRRGYRRPGHDREE